MTSVLPLLLVLCAGARAQNAAPRGPEEGFAFDLTRIELSAREGSAGLRRRMSGSELSHEDAFRLVLGKLAGSGVPEGSVRAAFDDPQTRVVPEIVERFGKPAEGMPYEQYRKIFLTEATIEGGARLVRERAALLAEVSARTGVDRHLATALVGVETRYGTRTGQFTVFNALYTAVRAVPKRSAWAAGELAELLKLCRAENLPAHHILGSYAGAFGFAQFIPSSFNRLAVDFDGDGRKRWNEWPDVLGSVGNYLARAGYTRGGSFERGSANWNAIYAYNHAENYVRVVLELRQAVLERSLAPSPKAACENEACDDIL